MKLAKHIGAAVLVVMLGSSVFLSTPAGAIDLPVRAAIDPVTDSYFNTEVTDNYRYMENLQSPQVQSWMKSQSEYARATLDSLSGRKALLDRIHALSNADISRGGFIRRGQFYFYQKTSPGDQMSRLFYRRGLQGAEHLILDPAALSKDPSIHYALDYYMPSWDGRYVVYGISQGGSEQSTLHVMEVESGTVLGESINRTSNSVIAWRPDSRAFFYMRYLKPAALAEASEAEYNARTYLHNLNKHIDGDGDAAVFGLGVSKQINVPEGQGTYVAVTPGSKYAIAVANHNLDDNPSTLFFAPIDQVAGGNTPWRKLADVNDAISDFVVHGDTLYFLSQKGASRSRLLATSLAHPDIEHATVILPESDSVIVDIFLAQEGLYVRERAGAVSHLRLVSLTKKQNQLVPLPFEGNITSMITDPHESGALFEMQSWAVSPRIIQYDPASNSTKDTLLSPPSIVDMSQLETKETFAVSDDGTRIPLSIISKKGIKFDGSHPTILGGYGSYGMSILPNFDSTMLAWIERGGVLAYAHVRGGGEYGEEWHTGGQKLTKSNSISDFIACGQYLIDQHYASPKTLAAQGSSAGGILVGGALTKRPDMFGVILDLVGLSDTLRFETEPNGPPNVSEFGSTKTEEGFHGLYAMSAYAHVRNGTPYPAVMFATGANDPRIAPWQMAKMTARLQEATSSRQPVLLRVDYDAGHGAGSTAEQDENLTADLWSFALWQMGDPEFQPAP